MHLKLFTAPTVAQAMALVRAELGADALILGSRKVATGIELTAALEPDAAPTAAPDVKRAAALSYHGVPDVLRGRLMRGDLARQLAKTLRFAGGEEPDDPLLFVGPPGAGKTLTLVKCATRMVLAGTTPSLISADCAKAGATEQLAVYARVLAAPMTAVADPIALANEVAVRRQDGPVLIDTPGGDIFDREHADFLRACGGGGKSVLVLPAGIDAAEASDVASAHAEAGASALIATRLDVSRRIGGIAAAAEASGLALSEAGISPHAAHGLTALTPAFLATRLMAIGKTGYGD
jgi:flagellar biosynthesis protein FlhF